MRGNYYVPSAVLNVPARYSHAVYRRTNGVQEKVFTEDENISWVGAKSYGGTEKTVDGVYAVEDTMEFTAYYDPRLKSGDRITLLGDGSVWDILNAPENVDMRGAFMRFKGRRYHNA